MTHLWIRAEQRPNETRVGVTPKGVTTLLKAGFEVSVERSKTRVIPDIEYSNTGCTMVAENAWPAAPNDALIVGLKELPTDTGPLHHDHVLFGHAYKGQPDGPHLLHRFIEGGGTLFDLEYLTDNDGRRVAAFGYWAGFAGAAMSINAWAAQKTGTPVAPARTYKNADEIVEHTKTLLETIGDTPTVLIIGALGRVGTGSADFAKRVGSAITKWDMAETASGGPFPEVLEHDVFLNCILASPKTPVFVYPDAINQNRRLSVIGDIACDPDNAFSPIKVYNRTTTWNEPVLRVSDEPTLDVMAIDNLPSMLPLESSLDFADQLLPHLLHAHDLSSGVWGRANALFHQHTDPLRK